MQLSEPLHYFIKHNPKNRSLVARMTDSYQQQLRKASTLLPEHDHASVAIGVHRRIDILISNGLNNAKDLNAKKVSCRAGCAHCCHLEMGVTLGEVQLLSMVIKDKQIPIDTERLRRQTQRPDGVWAELPLGDRQCVMLDPETKKCRVYEHRPTVCRKHHVITPPENCDHSKHPDGGLVLWFDPEAEVLMSVDHNLHGTGVLADMLHAMLKP